MKRGSCERPRAEDRNYSIVSSAFGICCFVAWWLNVLLLFLQHPLPIIILLSPSFLLNIEYYDRLVRLFVAIFSSTASSSSSYPFLIFFFFVFVCYIFRPTSSSSSHCCRALPLTGSTSLYVIANQTSSSCSRYIDGASSVFKRYSAPR